jgi:DNA polymerase-3 subunit beta
MKFTCEKSALAEAIATASRTVAIKSPIPALEGLLIEAHGTEVVVSGYNLKTGIRTRVDAEVAEPGSIVLNARLFGDIVRKMPDAELHFVCGSELMVKLDCAMSSFDIMGTSAEDYPEMPGVDTLQKVRVPEGVLKELIGETLFAVSTNEARPIHTGSLFELENGVLTVVSVDGFRLALRREKLEGEEDKRLSFVVPGSALTEVERIAELSEEPAEICLGDKHILFLIGSTELVARRLEGEFLDYRKSIPAAGKVVVSADRRELTNVIERISLLISEKYKSPVRCRFMDGQLRVSTATALGKAVDECPITGEGGGLEIGFNNRYLLDALKAAPGDTLRLQLTSAVAPCVLLPADEGDDSFVYLILPVRIRAEES